MMGEGEPVRASMRRRLRVMNAVYRLLDDEHESDEERIRDFDTVIRGLGIDVFLDERDTATAELLGAACGVIDDVIAGRRYMAGEAELPDLDGVRRRLDALRVATERARGTSLPGPAPTVRA